MEIANSATRKLSSRLIPGKKIGVQPLQLQRCQLDQRNRPKHRQHVVTDRILVALIADTPNTAPHMRQPILQVLPHTHTGTHIDPYRSYNRNGHTTNRYLSTSERSTHHAHLT